MPNYGKKYGCFIVFISKKYCCAAMKNLLADGRRGWVADGRLCRSRVAAKIFTKFLILCFAKFSSSFAKFKIILSQFCVSQNFDNAVSHPPYVGVEWGGGSGRYSPGTPFALTQIVSYSSSLYTVFHSAIYNSVGVVSAKAAFLIPKMVNWREKDRRTRHAGKVYKLQG